MEKDTNKLPDNKKKGFWPSLKKLRIIWNEKIKPLFLKNAQQNDQSNEQNTFNKENFENAINHMPKWPEILTGFSTFSALVFSIYSIFTLAVTENFLNSYNINGVNAQLTSFRLMLFILIATITTVPVMMLFTCVYLAFKNKIKKYSLAGQIVCEFVFFLFSGMILFAVLLALQNIKFSQPINVGEIAKYLIEIYTSPIYIRVIIAAVALLSIFAVLIKHISKNTSTFLDGIAWFLAFFICIMAIMISVQIEVDEIGFRTVHIDATEEMRTWMKNAPIADDGKQIWAVVYESKDFYFVEPLTIKSETDGEYTVDKDYYMTLNKADVIIYKKTVKNLNDELKKQKIMEHEYSAIEDK